MKKYMYQKSGVSVVDDNIAFVWRVYEVGELESIFEGSEQERKNFIDQQKGV